MYHTHTTYREDEVHYQKEKIRKAEERAKKEKKLKEMMEDSTTKSQLSEAESMDMSMSMMSSTMDVGGDGDAIMNGSSSILDDEHGEDGEDDEADDETEDDEPVKKKSRKDDKFKDT